MTRERVLGIRRDLDQSKAQRTARPMVPDRAWSSKHVRMPPLSAAFPHRSTCTKKQLAAREGSSHAPNVNPFDSEASTAAQEARFFATRKLSLHRRCLRRPSAPTVASEPRCQGGMDRCVGTTVHHRCAPTIRARQACNERAAFATSRTIPCAACGRTWDTVRTSSVVFSPLCPATIEARGLAMPPSNIELEWST